MRVGAGHEARLDAEGDAGVGPERKIHVVKLLVRRDLGIGKAQGLRAAALAGRAHTAALRAAGLGHGHGLAPVVAEGGDGFGLGFGAAGVCAGAGAHAGLRAGGLGRDGPVAEVMAGHGIVVHARKAQERVVLADFDGLPCFLRAAEVHCAQREAAGERTVADGRDAGGDGDLLERRAVAERARVDARHAGQDRHGSECRAALKRPAAGALEGAGQRDGRELFTIGEGRRAEGGQTCGQGDCLEIHALEERAHADARHARADLGAHDPAVDGKGVGADLAAAADGQRAGGVERPGQTVAAGAGLHIVRRKGCHRQQRQQQAQHERCTQKFLFHAISPFVFNYCCIQYTGSRTQPQENLCTTGTKNGKKPAPRSGTPVWCWV